jgi:hypothetical protein
MASYFSLAMSAFTFAAAGTSNLVDGLYTPKRLAGSSGMLFLI